MRVHLTGRFPNVALVVVTLVADVLALGGIAITVEFQATADSVYSYLRVDSFRKVDARGATALTSGWPCNRTR